MNYILFLLLYIVLHYIEGFPGFGGISMAQLWKIPLLLYLFAKLIATHRKLFKFEKCAYWYSFTPFFSIEVFSKPVTTFLYSIKQIPTVLFFNFWKRFDSIKLEKILLSLAQFICITSFLTLTGIIVPIKEYVIAESISDDTIYYSSLFGGAHAASSYFCIASLVILFFLLNKKIKEKKQRLFNIVLLCIGMYSIFLSFIRTGWIMFIVSLLFIVDFKKINNKKKIQFFFAFIILSLGIVMLYNNNESFRLRISGGGQYRGESETLIDTEGSGRTDFWNNGIDLWVNSNPYNFLFGNGTDAVVANNKEKTGMAVGSHSLFVDTLAKYGLVTFVFLLLFYYYQYRFISKFGRGSPYQSLCKSLFFGSILFAIFQGELYFDYSAIYALTLVLMYKTAIINN